MGRHPHPQHRHGLQLLTAALLAVLASSSAAATPVVRIAAEVSSDLRTVSGVIDVEGVDGSVDWIDPLVLLPDPDTDLTLVRTYPGRANHGAIATAPHPDGGVRFTARLPRRFGAVGRAGRGLYVNGGWYPQPTLDDSPLPIVDWDVELTLPAGTTGALGDVTGEGTLTWTGTGERAPLAVVRRGVLTAIRAPDVEVTLLSRGAPRKAVVRELTEQLPRAATGVALRGVVAVAPLRRRLVRHSNGLAYLSDRAFRLTPGLERFHRVAVVRGLATALVGEPDPFERELAGAALASDYLRSVRGDNAERWLRRFRWIPQVDWVLSSERMPYYAEVLERTHPGDPLHDDLAEVLAPATAGTVVYAQLDDTWGSGFGYQVGRDIARGVPADEAAARHGVDPAWLASWRAPYPVQDYTLDAIEHDPPAVVVTRHAPADAQAETLTVRLDDQIFGWQHPGGTATLPLSGVPDRVTLDPLRHTEQTSRLGDSWPPRYNVTFAAWLSSINLNQLQVYGTGAMTIRRQNDTHNLWSGRLFTSPGTLVGASWTWLRKEGPRLDAFRRPHRFSVSAATGLLEPELANVDRIGRMSVSSSLGYAWDDRVFNEFPLGGRRLSASVGGGLIPGLDERWGTSTVSVAGVVSPHPRHAFAGRTSASVAISNVGYRLLRLGGPAAMRSLPVLPGCVPDGPRPCDEQVANRLYGTLEYRVAPIRNASVPFLLFWGNELQLSGGVEGVLGRHEDTVSEVLGLTAGIGGIGDILGAEPTMMGLTAGWPVWWREARVKPSPIPQIYVRWGQDF